VGRDAVKTNVGVAGTLKKKIKKQHSRRGGKRETGKGLEDVRGQPVRSVMNISIGRD